jgi:hypothetical protein
MLRLYAAIHKDMNDAPLPAETKGKEEVAPQSRCRKRNSDSDDSSSNGKKESTEISRPLPVYQKPRPVITKNFFAPLRAVPMDGEEKCDERKSSSDERLDKGRSPTIILTSEAKFFSLQKKLKIVVTGEFYFRNTTSGIRITTRNMTDYRATQHLLNKKGLPLFTFYIKRDKLVRLFSGICSITPLPKTSQWLSRSWATKSSASSR